MSQPVRRQIIIADPTVTKYYLGCYYNKNGSSYNSILINRCIISSTNGDDLIEFRGTLRTRDGFYFKFPVGVEFNIVPMKFENIDLLDGYLNIECYNALTGVASPALNWKFAILDLEIYSNEY